MPLNRTTLERLLIDRALGVLPPDVDALLSNHLESDRTAAEQEIGFCTTVETVRNALQTESPPVLPPLPLTRLRRAHRHRRRIAVAAKAAGVVASVAVGILLGVVLFDHTTAAPESMTHTVVLESAPVERKDRRPAETSSTTSNFWSVHRWHRRANNGQPDATIPVRWTSPAKRPELRGEI